MEDIASGFDETEWEHYIQQNAKPLPEEISLELYENIQKQTLYADSASPKPRRIKYFYAAAAVAAALLLLGGFIALGVFYLPERTAVDPVSATLGRYSEQVNSADTVQIIVLPDASMVQLAPRSKLRYLQNFSARAREISLEGEAKFQVSKDVNRPFSVTCRGLVTQALGTVFTVKETALQTEVILHEGKVKVFAAGDTQRVSYLHAGDRVRYDAKENTWDFIAAHQTKTELPEQRATLQTNAAEEVDIKSVYTVENGQYIFKNVKFSLLIAALETIYTCKIGYPQDMAQQNMYLSIDTGQSITTVLNTIVQLNDLQLKKMGSHAFHIDHKN